MRFLWALEWFLKTLYYVLSQPAVKHGLELRLKSQKRWETSHGGAAWSKQDELDSFDFQFL